MSRIDRRKALSRLGSITIVPILSRIGPEGLFAANGHTHPRLPVRNLEGEWVPSFLNGNQTKTVTVLAELIIPETETPGAQGALVHQFIDYELSQAESPVQKRFLAGLEWLNLRSRELFGEDFVDLAEQQQIAILTILASPKNSTLEDEVGREFFQRFKLLTIRGYYSSEIGLMQELGYQGNTFLSEFPGCVHSEHGAGD